MNLETTTIAIEHIDLFKKKVLLWAAQFKTVCCLESNGYSDKTYNSYDFIIAVDSLSDIVSAHDSKTSFESLASSRKQKQTWQFGFLSYDLKNEIEHLSSEHADAIGLPLMYFFEPRYVLSIKDNKLSINRNYPESFAILEQINAQVISSKENEEQVLLKSRFTKEEYIEVVNKIKEHIIRGDVYEMNLCRELYAEGVELSTLDIFFSLNEMSQAPFASYFKYQDVEVICASPERYLKKLGKKMISQPIKGTIRRGENNVEDEFLKSALFHDEKERAENVMIVDLVRNDLTKFAVPGSIKVEELFGVHTFKTVHHLISTISAELKNEDDYINAIKQSFPMGSMTGAPKIKAMELIEKYERTKRGLFSGSIGYLSPDNDFDFNVVIRSIIYNSRDKYLSIQSGGAITIDSQAESEWEELNLKSKLLQQILNN